MDRVKLPVMLLSACLALCAGCSASTRPSLPEGWKTVTHRGVDISVPRSWTVEPWHANCGVTSPTVFIGPEGRAVLYCPLSVPGGSEVILGALPQVGGKAPVPQSINGLKALVTTTQAVFHGSLGATITYIYVSLPTKEMTIFVMVGDSARAPGGAPGRAMQIVETIHSAGK